MMILVLIPMKVVILMIVKEKRKLDTCPYCEAELDLNMSWDSLEDEGDTIVARARIECPECGATLNITACFNWDGDYKID